MAGHCPFPACLLSKGTATRILLPVSATFGTNEEVSEVLKFKQACEAEKAAWRKQTLESAPLREWCSVPTLDAVAERFYKNT